MKRKRKWTRGKKTKNAPGISSNETDTSSDGDDTGTGIPVRSIPRQPSANTPLKEARAYFDYLDQPCSSLVVVPESSTADASSRGVSVRERDDDDDDDGRRTRRHLSINDPTLVTEYNKYKSVYQTTAIAPLGIHDFARNLFPDSRDVLDECFFCE